MSHAIDLTWVDLSLSLVMMLGVIALDRLMKLAMGADLAIGTVRVFAQLYLVGFLLKWVFQVQSPWLVLLILFIMTLIAGYNAAKRAGDKTATTMIFASGMIILGTVASAGYALEVVMHVTPWYNPQYVIPIGGMAMNGAMNGVALGIANLRSGVKDNVDRIECALSVGATGPQAIHPILTDSVRRSLIPTINSLMTAGIVQLPGMMTGQIIAGMEPTSAVRYQIVIFYMLAVTTTLSALLAVIFYSRRMFTSAHQLRTGRALF